MICDEELGVRGRQSTVESYIGALAQSLPTLKLGVSDESALRDCLVGCSNDPSYRKLWRREISS